MTRLRRSDREASAGQALVVLVLSITVLLGGAAIVIDGGNAMGEQRGTQNAADAAALAGATVIAEKLGGADKTDAYVAAAMATAFTDNNSEQGDSYYIDFDGTILGTVGRGGSIPSGSAGIQAHGERTFDTFLASIAGQPTWTASATATALAGALRSTCPADEGCAVMPVTFSIPITSCDGTSRPLRIGVDWPITSLATARADGGGQYESIVPLCKNGPGGVGWLDMDCGGGNLNDQILHPCNGPFDIPTWLHTSPGNPNNVENAVNTYAGTVILVPMFDSTCREVPSTGLPADCTDAGNGTNLYYHIPRFAMFLLDRAYVQGNNNPECNTTPGRPLAGGNGGTSCFKGWFVRYIMQGRVAAYDGCTTADDQDTSTCQIEPLLAVQLVH